MTLDMYVGFLTILTFKVEKFYNNVNGNKTRNGYGITLMRWCYRLTKVKWVSNFILRVSAYSPLGKGKDYLDMIGFIVLITKKTKRMS